MRGGEGGERREGTIGGGGRVGEEVGEKVELLICPGGGGECGHLD